MGARNIIEIPCKIGDIVYSKVNGNIEEFSIYEVYPFGEPTFDFNSQTPKVYNVIASSTRNEDILLDDCEEVEDLYFRFEDMGNTVFTVKEFVV